VAFSRETVDEPPALRAPECACVPAGRPLQQKHRLPLEPRIAGLIEALARRIPIRWSILSTWKINLRANPCWRLKQIHCSFVKQPLNGQQGHEMAIIAHERMNKGLFDSAAAFQSDAMRFDDEIQSTMRAVAGRLQLMKRGWSSRRSRSKELIHTLKS
jgi:hypothetical protein